MPLFSVILPAYNREEYVSQTLKSLIAQTCRDWECIAVDDGSTDSTATLLASFAAGDHRIRTVRRTNGGPGAARNTGATLATGRYLAFLDSDDLWMPYAIETCRQALEQTEWPEYLAASLRTFSDDDDFLMAKRSALRVDRFPDALSACSQGHVVAGVPMTVVSTEAFKRIGGFLEDRLNAEDHDFTLRLGDCRGFVAVRSPVTVGYRWHESQETASSVKGVKGLLRLIERESAGLYPGGPERSHERRDVIAAHARPLCLAAGTDTAAAIRLYFATLPWQIEARRWRFLAAFFPLLLKNMALRANR